MKEAFAYFYLSFVNGFEDTQMIRFAILWCIFFLGLVVQEKAFALQSPEGAYNIQQVWNPKYSPDSKKIAMKALISKNGVQGYVIAVVNADGGDLTVITPITLNNEAGIPLPTVSALSHFDWATDIASANKFIILVDDTSTAWKLDVFKGDPKMLFKLPVSLKSLQCIEGGPLRGKLAITWKGLPLNEIDIVNERTGKMDNKISLGSHISMLEDAPPCFSANGKTVAFVALDHRIWMTSDGLNFMIMDLLVRPELNNGSYKYIAWRGNISIMSAFINSPFDPAIAQREALPSSLNESDITVAPMSGGGSIPAPHQRSINGPPESKENCFTMIDGSPDGKRVVFIKNGKLTHLVYDNGIKRVREMPISSAIVTTMW